LQDLPITYLHVFTYSRRKGTLADKMPQQVPNAVKAERTGILNAPSEIKKVAYKKLLIDQNVVLKGVVEAKNEMLSDHYLRVRLPDSVEQGSYASAPARAVQFIL